MSKNNIHVLARAVITDQDHILLCKTTDLANNFYYLPGGHVELGESAEEALIRELMEEVGVHASIKRFLGCLEYRFNGGHCHDHEYSFVFEVESDHLEYNIKPKSMESKLDLIWMPIKQLAEIDFRADPLKTLIPKWLNSPASNCFQSDIK